MAPKKKTGAQTATASTSTSTSNPQAASTATAVGDASVENDADTSTNQVGAGIDQFDLPKSVVLKLAKEEIPSNFLIRKDTTTALVKSSSVFINYLTAAAHEVAQRQGKKTIMASHVMEAMGDLEFPPEMFQEVMKEHLEGYRSREEEKKQAKSASRKEYSERTKADRDGNSASASVDGDVEDEEMADGDQNDDEEMKE